MKRTLLFASVIGLSLAASAQQHLNMSWEKGGARESCADLKISSDENQVARGEQQLTVQQGEVQTLTLTGSRNGGVHIYGWDQPRYEILACKAAFGKDEAEARQRLETVRIERQGDKVLATNATENALVVFIVRAPQNARLAADTYNGPLSLQNASGSFMMKSYNGPIEIKRTKGEVQAETHNGPVKFVGSGATLRLKTTNGPVDLDLESASWEGELTATTTNGPLKLSVPEGFNSAFLLEGDNGPIGCRGNICQQVSKTNEQGNKRLEFGSGPRIKGSTHNGPIAVDVLKANL